MWAQPVLVKGPVRLKVIFGTLSSILPYLPAGARRFLKWYVVLSCALGLLDIAALGVIAVALSSMASGSTTIDLPVVGSVEQSSFVWVILFACLLIVTKSGLSVLLQWFATRRFAAFELEIGDRLFDAYIRAPWTERLGRNTAQLVRLADVGIANVTSGFLLPVAGLPMQVVTLGAVLLVLAVSQPATAGITFVYLGLVAAFLYLWVGRRSYQAGRVNRDYSFRVATLMTEMVSALKEITLRDKAGEVAQVVHANRIHTTRARANISFLGAVPKFVIDSALIGGFVLVGGFAWLTQGQAEAFASVALFGVAGFRMVPALVTFQSTMSSATANIPHVQAVIGDIRAAQEYIAHAEQIGKAPIVGEPRTLELRDVAFTYPRTTIEAVHGINLSVPLGSTVGVVGQSGAGKSTLIDIFLGLLVPSRGSIMVGDQRLEDVLGAWRSRVGYVPQDVALFDGTVAQNVALSWSGDIDRDRVVAVLEQAQLWDVVASREGGIDARIGERGMAFSGGQRQRLGIARALYSDPLVLVLDEATSALDTKTEASVAEAISGLRGRVTVISVAHRLSTVRNNDLICFMRDGTIVDQGRFDELVERVPEFAVQATLAGLV